MQFIFQGDVTFRNVQYIVAVLNYSMHHKNSILLIPLSVMPKAIYMVKESILCCKIQYSGKIICGILQWK